MAQTRVIICLQIASAPVTLRPSRWGAYTHTADCAILRSGAWHKRKLVSACKLQVRLSRSGLVVGGLALTLLAVHDLERRYVARAKLECASCAGMNCRVCNVRY